MADLTAFHADPTLEAVDRAIVARAKEELARPYLGMSGIGRECKRATWYSFRWVDREDFDADTLKRFEDGHKGEDLQADRLRLVPGIELHTVDPVNGKQFACRDHHDHFRGHLDGAIHGLLQAPKTWHVWEHKSVGEDKFKKLQALKSKHDEKEVLAQWDETYHVQAQLYMHYTGMHRHYLTVSTPGGRRTESARSEYDPTVALREIAKAESIIFATEPPPKLRDDPKFYLCSWCAFKDVCHGTKRPALNCRTCVHSTPERRDGAWSCGKHQNDIPVATQRAGCDEHLPLPYLMPGLKAIDAGDEWILFARADGSKLVITTDVSIPPGELPTQAEVVTSREACAK